MPTTAAAAAGAASAAGGANAASGLLSAISGAVPGLSPQQASLGVGALLSLAKAKMPAAQFSQLSQAISGVDALMGTAQSSGLPAQLTGLSDLTPTLSKAGISPEMVSQMIPALGDAVGKAGGPELASSLLAALR